MVLYFKIPVCLWFLNKVNFGCFCGGGIIQWFFKIDFPLHPFSISCVMKPNQWKYSCAHTELRSIVLRLFPCEQDKFHMIVLSLAYRHFQRWLRCNSYYGLRRALVQTLSGFLHTNPWGGGQLHLVNLTTAPESGTLLVTLSWSSRGPCPR